MIRKEFRYILEYYIKPSRFRKRVALPTILNFPITDNCNARCVMCDVWKEKSTNELTVDDFKKILNDSLFRNIEHVGISGGEPSLVRNLVDYFTIILSSLPNLKSISITSHSFLPKRWKEFFPKLKDLAIQYDVKFVFNMSLDGVGEVHDQIRMIPNGFNKLIETYNLAKEHNISVQFQATISRGNVFSCPSILEYCKRLGEEVVFRKATKIERLYNDKSIEDVDLNSHGLSFFKDFLESDNLNSYTYNIPRRLFYKDLSKRLVSGSERNAPCKFQNEGVLLSSHGDLFLCSISDVNLGNVKNKSASSIYFSKRTNEIRKKLISETCISCIHDQSGAWKPSQLLSEKIRLKSRTSVFKKYFDFIKYSILNLK